MSLFNRVMESYTSAWASGGLQQSRQTTSSDALPLRRKRRKGELIDPNQFVEQSPTKVPGSGWLRTPYPAGTKHAGKVDAIVKGREAKKVADALRWLYDKRVVQEARRPLATVAERIDVAGVYVTNTKTGKKLLLKRRDGRWDITKGGVDKGEKPKQAAKREAGEESGIIPKVSAVYVDVTNPKNKKKLRIYKGSTKKTKIKLMPSEHTKAKWVDDDEAIEKLQQTPHLAKAVAKLRKLGEAGSLFARVVESYPNRVRGQARDLAVPGGGDKQPPEAPSDEPEQPLDSPGPGNVNVRTTQRAAGSKMHKQREPNVPPVALRQLRPLPALP